jgi:hypothetical protein
LQRFYISSQMTPPILPLGFHLRMRMARNYVVF